MEALEEILPMRRGISNFYNGKSKSFVSLADASSSPSIKGIAKQENAYMRKRRNLLASTLDLDNRNRSSPLKSNGGGVSKRVTNSNRSTLALAVTLSSSTSGSCNNDSDHWSHYPLALSGSTSTLLRARLHSQWRDFQPNGGSLFLSSPGQNFSAWIALLGRFTALCFHNSVLYSFYYRSSFRYKAIQYIVHVSQTITSSHKKLQEKICCSRDCKFRFVPHLLLRDDNDQRHLLKAAA